MIYMDNAATTAVRKEVAEAMLPYLLGDYGNPSGVYRLSEKAKNVVEESRGIIADIINADRNEIFSPLVERKGITGQLKQRA